MKNNKKKNYFNKIVVFLYQFSRSFFSKSDKETEEKVLLDYVAFSVSFLFVTVTMCHYFLIGNIYRVSVFFGSWRHDILEWRIASLLFFLLFIMSCFFFFLKGGFFKKSFLFVFSFGSFFSSIFYWVRCFFYPSVEEFSFGKLIRLERIYSIRSEEVKSSLVTLLEEFHLKNETLFSWVTELYLNFGEYLSKKEVDSFLSTKRTELLLLTQSSTHSNTSFWTPGRVVFCVGLGVVLIVGGYFLWSWMSTNQSSIAMKKEILQDLDQQLNPISEKIDRLGKAVEGRIASNASMLEELKQSFSDVEVRLDYLRKLSVKIGNFSVNRLEELSQRTYYLGAKVDTNFRFLFVRVGSLGNCVHLPNFMNPQSSEDLWMGNPSRELFQQARKVALEEVQKKGMSKGLPKVLDLLPD